MGAASFWLVNTIDALERDILLQVSYLGKFRPQKPIPKARQLHAIFCGSGDSLAASMLAESFSGLSVKAADPLDLLKNPEIPKKSTVYIVSISGRTISNIRVARLAKRSTAITSNAKSRLARATDDVISLQFPNSDVFTAGSISYLESALTCISLVKSFRVKDPKKIFQSALRKSKGVRLSGKIFFLGNLFTYPSAMYAAAKIYEILGLDAHYERIEQFSHMELFSASRGDTVVIFEPKNPHNSLLARTLKKIGLNVVHPDPGRSDRISDFLFYTFFSQLLPLRLAKKNCQRDCHFVTAKKLRSASDQMIY